MIMEEQLSIWELLFAAKAYLTNIANTFLNPIKYTQVKEIEPLEYYFLSLCGEYNIEDCVLENANFKELLNACDEKIGIDEFVAIQNHPIIKPKNYPDFLASLLMAISTSELVLDENKRFTQSKILIESDKINLNFIQKGHADSYSNLYFCIVAKIDSEANQQIKNNHLVLFKMMLNKGAKIACDKVNKIFQLPIYSVVLNESEPEFRDGIIEALQKDQNHPVSKIMKCSGQYKELISDINDKKKTLELNHAQLIDHFNGLCLAVKDTELNKVFETILLCGKRCAGLGQIPKVLMHQIFYMLACDFQAVERCN